MKKASPGTGNPDGDDELLPEYRFDHRQARPNRFAPGVPGGRSVATQDREIEIAVTEADDSTEDETAYLLRSPANRERLLKAIDNVAHGRDLEVVDPDDLA